MEYYVFQNNFNGGILSDDLTDRTETVVYPISLKDCTNFMLTTSGILEKRRGSIYINNAKASPEDNVILVSYSFSEEQITKAMNNLFKWRTVIVIAHRLQTVRHADKIFVLENWKVVEEWNHEKLVKKWWIYNKMLELQSGF